MIRLAEKRDTAAIAEIYNYYINHTVVTFEETCIDAEEVEQRIAETEAAALPYLVAETADGIAGYAYASSWNGRCAYKHSVEITVYLSQKHSRKGYGTALYNRLFEELRQRNYHVIIAGISLPNPGSIALHERFGMEKVAHFSEVGFKFDEWIDVGYWQGMLDT